MTNAILDFFGIGRQRNKSRTFSKLYKRHLKGDLVHKSAVTSTEHDALSRLLVDKAIEEKMHGWGDSLELFKIPQPKKIIVEKTDLEKVEDIINEDFEKQFGMSFEKFIRLYHQLLDEQPEKFI